MIYCTHTVHVMETERRSRYRPACAIFVYNRSHGENISSLSGEAEPFVQYFFKKWTTKHVTIRIYLMYQCIVYTPFPLRMSPMYDFETCLDSHSLSHTGD
jgi:hypothetical protein